MRTKVYGSLLAAALITGVLGHQVFVTAGSPENPGAKTKLAVLWTSGDSEVAHKVCFMYTQAAKKAQWFDEVVLIVWGPSSRLLAGDKELQAAVKAMIASGVVVQACVACADMYGVADTLRQMGIEVKPMGRPLSDMLKTDWKVLTF
jgi:hypothetical protein